MGPLFHLGHPTLNLLTSCKHLSVLLRSCFFLSITRCVTFSWRSMKCSLVNSSLVYSTLHTYCAWFPGLTRTTPPISSWIFVDAAVRFGDQIEHGCDDSLPVSFGFGCASPKAESFRLLGKALQLRSFSPAAAPAASAKLMVSVHCSTEASLH